MKILENYDQVFYIVEYRQFGIFAFQAIERDLLGLL